MTSSATISSEVWRQAACLGLSEAMFSERRDAEAEALALCSVCPVREQCLAMTVAAEASTGSAMLHGVAGGLTPRQRLPLVLRERRRRAA